MFRKTLLIALMVGMLALTGTGYAHNLFPLQDMNPDPDIVEVFLEARVGTAQYIPGSESEIYTYNGSVPGPLIQGKVGDTLIVHFTNNLPEETTVHWHGVEVPADMDGSNISQGAVPPGGYFRYEFKLLNGATHWYHPHIRTNEQVERGLYGALVIRDPDEDANLGLPEAEWVFILDDILLDENGQLVEEPFPSDPVERAAVQVNGREGNAIIVSDGRSTDVIDARQLPWRIRHRRRVFIAGVPQRWRIINVSNTRFMRLSIPGHTLWRIGGDGGLLETPIPIPPIDMIPDPGDPSQMISDPDPSKGLLLTPSERADIVFTPMPQPDGDPLFVEWHDIPRGRHRAFPNDDGSIGLGHAHNDGKRPPILIMRFSIVGSADPADAYVPPEILRTIPQLDITDAAPLPVFFGHTPPNENGDITFFVDFKRRDDLFAAVNARQAVMPPMFMPMPFPKVTTEDALDIIVGETRVWEVTNFTGGDHNFHPHGFFFQHLETEFVDLDNPDNNRVVPTTFIENKDSVKLPRRPGAIGRSWTTLRLAMHFDDTGREGLVGAFDLGAIADPVFGMDNEGIIERGQSGGWVFHCHLLEHADLGMMSLFNLSYPVEQ